MAKKIPGEAGGRRRIGKDRGDPKAGRNTPAGQIKGSEVKFKTSGGKELGHGGPTPSRLRIIGDVLFGRHRKQ
jgi:hypothetical protein